MLDNGIRELISMGIHLSYSQLPPLATVEVDKTARGTGLIGFRTRNPFYENVSWAHVSMQNAIAVEMLVACNDL